MLKEQEPGVALEMLYIVRCAGNEVVKTSHLMAVIQQPFAQVGADKACRS